MAKAIKNLLAKNTSNKELVNQYADSLEYDVQFETLEPLYAKERKFKSEKFELEQFRLETDMNRGITSLMAEGGYTHNQKKLLYVAVTTSQMISLKNKILRIDPKAFITIIDVSEVKGKGFQSI